MKSAAPVDAVAHSRGKEAQPVRFFPIRLITVELSLLAVEQLIELSDIGHSRMRAPQTVHHATLVRPYVHLHAEMPGVAFLRLLHLRIATLRSVLRRTRGSDDRRVHDRSGLHQQPFLLK